MKKFDYKKILKVLKMVLYVVITIFVVLFFISVCLQRFSGNRLSFFDYRMFTVVSGSMEPKYNIGDVLISKEIAMLALDKLNVDALGLDEVDIRYLKGIIERYHGGPVGLEALASAISEEATTLEDVYEPYLIQIGFINRTPRGRIATPKAYQHLHIAHNDQLFD